LACKGGQFALYLGIMSPAPTPSSKAVVWEDSPSQLLNLGYYLICFVVAAGLAAGAVMSGFYPLLIGLVVPFFYGLWRYLVVRCERYKLYEERLIVHKGVLNKIDDSIELYRIKDFTVSQPLFLRLVGAGNLILHTSDRTSPEIHLRAVKKAEDVRCKLRDVVEHIREKKRVREIDFADGGMGDGGDMEGLNSL